MGSGKAPGSGAATRLVQGNRFGKGGVDRGRGDAALGLTGDTEGDTDDFKAQRLAHGMPIPSAPSFVTYGRADPEANPIADSGAGSAGDSGAGAATWRRRVAPHLREVVREFFSPASETPASGKAGVPPSSNEGGAGSPSGK